MRKPGKLPEKNSVADSDDNEAGWWSIVIWWSVRTCGQSSQARTERELMDRRDPLCGNNGFCPSSSCNDIDSGVATAVTVAVVTSLHCILRNHSLESEHLRMLLLLMLEMGGVVDGGGDGDGVVVVTAAVTRWGLENTARRGRDPASLEIDGRRRGRHGEEGFDGVSNGVGVERRLLGLRRPFAQTAIHIAVASLLLLAADVLFLFFVIVTLVRLLGGGNCISSGGLPGGEFGEFVDGGFDLIDEPIDGLFGAIVAKAVLNIIELNGSVGGPEHHRTKWSFLPVDLTMPPCIFAISTPPLFLNPNLCECYSRIEWTLRVPPAAR
ncbi:hypothetical protein ACLOJK_032582 [Asimina triloba]